MLVGRRPVGRRRWSIHPEFPQTVAALPTSRRRVVSVHRPTFGTSRRRWPIYPRRGGVAAGHFGDSYRGAGRPGWIDHRRRVSRAQCRVPVECPVERWPLRVDLESARPASGQANTGSGLNTRHCATAMETGKRRQCRVPGCTGPAVSRKRRHSNGNGNHRPLPGRSSANQFSSASSRTAHGRSWRRPIPQPAKPTPGAGVRYAAKHKPPVMGTFTAPVTSYQ